MIHTFSPTGRVATKKVMAVQRSELFLKQLSFL